jgi:transposase-like protein
MTSDSSRSDSTAAPGPVPGPAPNPAPDWAAIRQAYVGQGATVRNICRAHGIQVQTLYRMAGKHDWPRRRESGTNAQERKTLQLLARLRRIAEGQIDEIEARRARPDPSSPGEPERDARALTALVKLIEHIAAVEAKHRMRRNGSGGASEIDRARRRADLANKLVAMLEQERDTPLPE